MRTTCTNLDNQIKDFKRKETERNKDMKRLSDKIESLEK